MGAGYGIGLRGQLSDDAPKEEVIDIISQFAQQGYLRKFVEVIDGEVYIFDAEATPLVQKCHDEPVRTEILTFYQHRYGGSMPYSSISALVNICDGDTLGGLTDKATTDFGRWSTKRVDFDTERDRNRTLGSLYPAFWELRDIVRKKKSERSLLYAEYLDEFEGFYNFLKAVTGFYKKTGYVFLVAIGDW